MAVCCGFYCIAYLLSELWGLSGLLAELWGMSGLLAEWAHRLERTLKSLSLEQTLDMGTEEWSDSLKPP